MARALLLMFGLLGSASSLIGCKSDCLREDCASAESGTASPSAGSSAGSAGSASTDEIAAGKACTVNDDCRFDQGEACIESTCRVPCSSHFDCQGFGLCTSSTDSAGNRGHYCALGSTQPAGQFYAHCLSGTDADCDSAHAFFCVSASAGDLESYCTIDCTDDSACAPGYACTPLTRNPCADACGLPGKPEDHNCVPLEQVGPGKAFQCGKRGVTRTACRPRQFCSNCESDTDCLATTNQVCAQDESGAKICTEVCDLKHPSCPWGSAAQCKVWDSDLGGLATCSHRFGSCQGTGKPCEPCLMDADCGPHGACYAQEFTGEHWCVDLNQMCDCGANSKTGLCTGGGCTQSPSGLEMLCSDPTTSTPNDGVCFGANTSNTLITATSQQTGCWPAN